MIALETNIMDLSHFERMYKKHLVMTTTYTDPDTGEVVFSYRKPDRTHEHKDIMLKHALDEPVLCMKITHYSAYSDWSLDRVTIYSADGIMYYINSPDGTPISSWQLYQDYVDAHKVVRLYIKRAIDLEAGKSDPGIVPIHINKCVSGN